MLLLNVLATILLQKVKKTPPAAATSYSRVGVFVEISVAKTPFEFGK